MKLEPANDEEPAGGSPRPVRRAGTPWPVELAVIFALIFVLDAALGPDTPLLGARPHVFWVPVLAMASVHGLVPGLLAALSASALSWWTLPRLSPALADHFAQWADYWHEPILWFAAALLLGSYRDAQVRRRREAEARASQAERRSETVAAYAAELRAHIAVLEGAAAMAPPPADERDPSRVVPFARPDAGSPARRQNERKP